MCLSRDSKRGSPAIRRDRHQIVENFSDVDDLAIGPDWNNLIEGTCEATALAAPLASPLPDRQTHQPHQRDGYVGGSLADAPPAPPRDDAATRDLRPPVDDGATRDLAVAS